MIGISSSWAFVKTAWPAEFIAESPQLLDVYRKVIESADSAKTTAALKVYLSSRRKSPLPAAAPWYYGVLEDVSTPDFSLDHPLVLQSINEAATRRDAAFFRILGKAMGGKSAGATASICPLDRFLCENWMWLADDTLPGLCWFRRQAIADMCGVGASACNERIRRLRLKSMPPMVRDVVMSTHGAGVKYQSIDRKHQLCFVEILHTKGCSFLWSKRKRAA